MSVEPQVCVNAFGLMGWLLAVVCALVATFFSGHASGWQDATHLFTEEEGDDE